ncbi:FadR/GntR family transcriptional regulator [Kaistia algarum]|uniref:FadR/GntR family transcriptional regulator n=1 Tax=Kaistia algarum TaxID=2083279 RepID=UPI0014040875|nr:FadR/GntR family transcriptional regulator [Kaistia algarum]MCX5516737.1 FadR/GntR family transcriptional regulator [Kaistia algarum]
MGFLDDVGRFSKPTGINRRRLHGSVAHELAVRIISGQLKPGEVLPNEDDLSAAMEVSRTAYRESMRTLVAKGFVSAKPKVGTTVNPRSSWNILDSDVLSWYFEVKPDAEFIRSLFELRRIVEPAGAALAATRHEDEDAVILRQTMAAMRPTKESSAEGLEADVAFHHAILVAARNEPLLALSSVIESTLRWSARLKMTAHPRIYEETLPDHVVVLEAILRRDSAGASASMASLVDKALEETLQTMQHQRAVA